MITTTDGGRTGKSAMTRKGKKSEQIQWIVGAAIFAGALLSGLPLGAGASDELPLKITYSHGSGVNPRHMERSECKLDTRSMKSEEAAKLLKLVNSSNIMATTERDYQQTEGGPFYMLEIEAPKQKRKFEWSYTHAPSSIQPLVRYLEDNSKKTVYENGKELN